MKLPNPITVNASNVKTDTVKYTDNLLLVTTKDSDDNIIEQRILNQFIQNQQQIPNALIYNKETGFDKVENDLYRLYNMKNNIVEILTQYLDFYKQVVNTLDKVDEYDTNLFKVSSNLASPGCAFTHTKGQEQPIVTYLYYDFMNNEFVVKPANEDIYEAIVEANIEGLKVANVVNNNATNQQV